MTSGVRGLAAAGVGWAFVVVPIFLLPYAQLPIWPFAYSTVLLMAWGGLRWGRDMAERMALPRAAPGWVAIAVMGLGLWAVFALVFAGLHVVLYGLGAYARWLDPLTVVTLMAVGALRNVLLLLPGHIGWAFALHAAWNVSMLAGAWLRLPGYVSLTELEVFDAFLGHPVMVVATLVAAALGHVWIVRRSVRTAAGATPGP